MIASRWNPPPPCWESRCGRVRGDYWRDAPKYPNFSHAAKSRTRQRLGTGAAPQLWIPSHSLALHGSRRLFGAPSSASGIPPFRDSGTWASSTCRRTAHARSSSWRRMERDDERCMCDVLCCPCRIHDPSHRFGTSNLPIDSVVVGAQQAKNGGAVDKRQIGVTLRRTCPPQSWG